MLAFFLLLGVWSPLLGERFASRPLLGRVAVRDADPAKPEGLRIELLVEAAPWLQTHLRPTDVTVTSLPRQLAWYADLGVRGLENLIDLGSQPRTPAERRQYLLERLGPEGVDYVVEFNVDWYRPDSERAREWQFTFEALRALPNVEVAYLRRDVHGSPVFYVVRNHGYARPPAA